MCENCKSNGGCTSCKKNYNNTKEKLISKSEAVNAIAKAAEKITPKAGASVSVNLDFGNEDNPEKTPKNTTKTNNEEGFVANNKPLLIGVAAVIVLVTVIILVRKAKG